VNGEPEEFTVLFKPPPVLQHDPDGDGYAFEVKASDLLAWPAEPDENSALAWFARVLPHDGHRLFDWQGLELDYLEYLFSWVAENYWNGADQAAAEWTSPIRPVSFEVNGQQFTGEVTAGALRRLEFELGQDDTWLVAGCVMAFLETVLDAGQVEHLVEMGLPYEAIVEIGRWLVCPDCSDSVE
jgi:hypothetical protein